MPKPEPVDTLLSPSLRVSRPVAACSRCRAAKIKCDGRLPACTACERSGKADSCSGANDEFAKGKERSYVAALEAACERLQRRIVEARAAHASAAANQSNNQFLMPPNVSPNAPKGRRQRKEASDVDDLVGDFGFLSVNATSRDFHGFSQTMSFYRLLLAVSTVSPLPTFGNYPLPPRYAATPLIQHYLDNIFVLYPFFSETELMASVSAIYQENGRYAKVSDHWSLRMVLAIAAASTSQQRGDSNHQIALRHVSAALDRAESVLHPGSMEGIQAILLLVQYSMLDPGHFNSWQLIGMAARVMVDLGLHQEPAIESKVSKERLDLRRRVFYCVYAMDRNIAIVHGRAFSFTDDSSAVAFPSLSHHSDGSFSGWTNPLFLRSLQPALYLFDIRRVQSQAYQELHKSGRLPESELSGYTWGVYDDIRKWLDSIPQDVSQRMRIFFRLEALYSYILALSPSLKIPVISDLSKTLIFEHAIEFADQMQPVIQDTSWHPFLSYLDLNRVYFVGKQFLDALWQSYELLLSGAVPAVPPLPPSSAQPPLILPGSRRDNLNRATKCLNKIIEILGFARERWDIGHLRDTFEQGSAVMLGKLRLKQQELQVYPQNQQSSYNRRSPVEGDLSQPTFPPEEGAFPTGDPRRISTYRRMQDL